MTPFTQLTGLYGPKGDTARQLYRVTIDCGIECWDEYVVCRGEDELNAFMAEHDLVSGKDNYSVKVTRLTGGSLSLDSLWISS